jgi:thiosulfate/3-mercaptopyruvate sulfurtransferase
MNSLVSTEWLAARLGSPELRVIDASFKMPGVRPTARDTYRDAHIPGAAFFDIDEIADRQSHLPHMLPTPDVFAQKVGALGIGNENEVVLYDATGIAGAARAWWMLRIFGHAQVAVLDGGLRKWLAEGRPVDAAAVTPTPATFMPRFDASLVRSRDQVLANIDARREQMLDARSAERFEGTAPEPWPGRRSGHIPGSFNLDHASLLNQANGTLRSTAALTALFETSGVDLSKPIVTSCGSGITACVLAFALDRVGHSQAAVYDGSWAEWGLPGELPVETGAPR